MLRIGIAGVIGAIIGAVAATLIPRAIPAPPPVRPIKIGHQNDLTGILNFWGVWAGKAVAEAVKAVNAEKGVLGRPLELIVEDTASSPAVAVRKFEKLVQAGAEILLSPVHSGSVVASNVKAKEFKRLYFIPIPHATAITAEAANRYVFRPCMSSVRSEVFGMRSTFEEIGRNWVIVFADYAFGWAYRDDIKEFVEKPGLIKVKEYLPLPWPPPPDVLPIASKIAALKPLDGIFYLIPSPTASMAFAKALLDLGLTEIPRLVPVPSVEGYNLASVSKANPGIFDNLWVEENLLPQTLADYDTPHHRELRRILGIAEDGSDIGNPENVATMKVTSAWSVIHLIDEVLEETGWRGPEDNHLVIKALEDRHLKESRKYPQGDIWIRPEDHQGFFRMFISEFKNGALRVKKIVPAEETIYPAPVDLTKQPV